MPRSKTDPAFVRSAVTRVRAGASLRAVAESLKVDPSTVHRWVKAAAAAVSREPDSWTNSEAVAAAVSVFGDDWTIAEAAELAEVPQDAVRIWLRARVDALLARKGFPPAAVRTGLEFSGMHV